MSDETEDALALANSARDAQPPRFDDAQKAYQLAAKLSPKDPRPYMGLANIWYDQKHFEEAARMYRAAAQLMVSSNAAAGRISDTKATVRGKSSKATEVVPGDLRAYLGNALLQAAQFSDAERELRIAILQEPKDGQLYALLGYSLLQQNKRPEAITAFRTAATLSPDNTAYKDLLDATVNHP